jgi:hypothetical protein
MILASGTNRGGVADLCCSNKYAYPLLSVTPAPLSIRPVIAVSLPFNRVISVSMPRGLGDIISVEVG